VVGRARTAAGEQQRKQKDECRTFHAATGKQILAPPGERWVIEGALG